MSELSQEPIQKLFQNLDSHLRRDPNGADVLRLLSEYIENHQDWKDYVHFNKFKYCRNLVNSSDVLELIVLCWLPNQVSPIHNHAGQQCWASVLDGEIQETQFHFKNTHSTFGEGPLEVSGTLFVKKGQVSYISDDIALHVIQPMNNQSGITLHLYSKPITECNIYCQLTGKITKRKMGFHTIKKQLVESPICSDSKDDKIVMTNSCSTNTEIL